MNDNSEPKFEYRGYQIPFFIKFIWTLLILWGLYYSFTYAVPNLLEWLKK